MGTQYALLLLNVLQFTDWNFDRGSKCRGTEQRKKKKRDRSGLGVGCERSATLRQLTLTSYSRSSSAVNYLAVKFIGLEVRYAGKEAVDRPAR
jgi:hypothetical protein